MAEVLSVIEYPEEGIAIIEDTQGKFIASQRDLDIIPYNDYEAWLGRKQVCALLQSREAMLT